jgi:hypothetical protein
VQKISARGPDGKWHPLFTAKSVTKVDVAHRFAPAITPTNYKSNALRIDFDLTCATTAGTSMHIYQLDGVCLYGYADVSSMSSIAPRELIDKEYQSLYDDELNDDMPIRTEMKHSPVIQSLSVCSVVKTITLAL